MSTLDTVLICIAALSGAIFLKPLVLDPLAAAGALRAFYRLPKAQRQSDMLMAVSREWWNIVLVPACLAAALVIIGCLGGGQ